MKYSSSHKLPAFTPMIQITVNNQSHSLPEGSTIDALLAQLQLTGKRLAVEMNGEIVPKSRHNTTPLSNGAVLEIVVAVGGG